MIQWGERLKHVVRRLQSTNIATHICIYQMLCVTSTTTQTAIILHRAKINDMTYVISHDIPWNQIKPNLNNVDNQDFVHDIRHESCLRNVCCDMMTRSHMIATRNCHQIKTKLAKVGEMDSIPRVYSVKPYIEITKDAGSQYSTVYPKKYAHGFVVFCFVVVVQSFIMNSHEVFIHIHQGCFAGSGAIVRLPQCQWSKSDGYGKISQCITTTKHSKAKTVSIFLGIYCTKVEIQRNHIARIVF